MGDAVVSAAAGASETGGGRGEASASGAARIKYPLKVTYCRVCTLPAEVHDYVSRNQFAKCREWLRTHAPELFPDEFPAEVAARQQGLVLDVDSEAEEEAAAEDAVRVAVPIEQKTSGGKKKKAPAEIHLALGQRKGKKQVTIVYGLDLFGIKLKEAAKAAKRKFATGSSVTTVRYARREVRAHEC